VHFIFLGNLLIGYYKTMVGEGYLLGWQQTKI